ncbi:MAG: TonB-dependent receptor family protein, partial [Nonlabens sp.]|nr:TonB-dependent receptor family protein [Nonlabens sp.]
MTKLFFTLVVLFSISSFAQQVTVSGKLVDKDSGAPLEFATVSFISNDASVSAQGGVTDLDGNYSILISPGTYKVKFEYITFKTVEKLNQVINENKDYGTISLTVDVAVLDAAVVIAEKTTVDIRLDKKIYNVGKDLTVRGGTASDVLNNVPSVSVDVEGNVALRGNDNVRILIDGRPSALVGFNGADALRQIPAEAIEKIEVITSPSARYDAEGTAGILNIILRKEKLRGFNGALQVNGGIPATAGTSLNGNYRTEKFNFFTNTGFNYRENPGNSSSFTRFLEERDLLSDPAVITRTLDETRKFNRKGNNFFTSLGAEYYINESSSIIGNIVYRLGNDDDFNTNFSERINADGSFIESTFRTEAEAEDDTSIQYTLDYKNDLDEDGQKLTASLQYSVNKEDKGSSIFETDNLTNLINDRELVAQVEDERNALLQIDYELPIGENVNWEAGYRGNYRDITNSFFLEERQNFPDGPLVPDAGLNNTFLYEELINAVYVQYGRKVNNFSLLAGLRYENTLINIEQVTTNDKTSKDFNNLFPTINLGYEIGQTENITLGYNRRVSRPRGRFLNPFPSRSSESNIFQGNVDLNPTFSNGLDLGYLKRWQKVTLSTSIYANRSEDNWEFIQEPTGATTDNGDPVIRRFPINLSTQDRYGYELTLTYRPYKWWTVNSDLNVFRVINDGDYVNLNGDVQNFDFKNTTYNIRLNQKFTLPTDIDFQVNMNYNGASANAQGTNDGIGTVNL